MLIPSSIDLTGYLLWLLLIVTGQIVIAILCFHYGMRSAKPHDSMAKAAAYLAGLLQFIVGSVLLWSVSAFLMILMHLT